MTLLLWAAAPYAAIALLVFGTVWRYRHDKFGWTSRSTQLHESRMLKVASPLFHFGLFMVLGGHILGLLVPKAVTAWFGISDENYHLVSLGMGTLAGLAAVGGLGLLLYRRLRNPAVRKTTSTSDKFTYAVLLAGMLAGLATTVIDNGIGGGYDYRETIGPWVRGILTFDPHPELMADAPFGYQLHTVLGQLLFALWPFSRLVHAFSAPVQYLMRPYVVYRRRVPDRVGSRPPRRGWE
ncbi:respiratory nitrate reductase subunit gamma [Amycolatopsis suaedae]|uniref:Nitrate reductase-like protein NarX n=1 Tax=Amycolatopsis suaedae TaxID=2510978 RepID=A0A4Q7JA74_9PSEU|nr:respiratory nitrate reductase subunit gamma [Amycolatopsis suaedae]RZQ63363.1 respiratory nitrate reductase subunit gamma [Amycolatopsis suaedae]